MKFTQKNILFVASFDDILLEKRKRSDAKKESHLAKNVGRRHLFSAWRLSAYVLPLEDVLDNGW